MGGGLRSLSAHAAEPGRRIGDAQTVGLASAAGAVARRAARERECGHALPAHPPQIRARVAPRRGAELYVVNNIESEISGPSRWGAHAPSRAVFRALAENPEANRPTRCAGTPHPAREGAGRNTRGACAPRFMGALGASALPEPFRAESPNRDAFIIRVIREIRGLHWGVRFK